MKISVPHTADEHSLIMRCMKGNEPARKAVYIKYVEEVMIVCLRYIADKEDAKEVMMDAFLKFFNALDGFEYRGEGSVRAWLKKITVNECLMFLRKKVMSFDQISDSDFYGAPVVMESVSDQMHVKDILKLVHTLPPGCKAVFNLYVFEDKGHKEIAQLLQISEGTSKSQLHLARKILKDKLLINI